MFICDPTSIFVKELAFPLNCMVYWTVMIRFDLTSNMLVTVCSLQCQWFYMFYWTDTLRPTLTLGMKHACLLLNIYSWLSFLECNQQWSWGLDCWFWFVLWSDKFRSHSSIGHDGETIGSDLTPSPTWFSDLISTVGMKTERSIVLDLTPGLTGSDLKAALGKVIERSVGI